MMFKKCKADTHRHTHTRPYTLSEAAELCCSRALFSSPTDTRVRSCGMSGSGWFSVADTLDASKTRCLKRGNEEKGKEGLKCWNAGNAVIHKDAESSVQEYLNLTREMTKQRMRMTSDSVQWKRWWKTRNKRQKKWMNGDRHVEDKKTATTEWADGQKKTFDILRNSKWVCNYSLMLNRKRSPSLTDK